MTVGIPLFQVERVKDASFSFFKKFWLIFFQAIHSSNTMNIIDMCLSKIGAIAFAKSPFYLAQQLLILQEKRIYKRQQS